MLADATISSGERVSDDGGRLSGTGFVSAAICSSSFWRARASSEWCPPGRVIQKRISSLRLVRRSNSLGSSGPAGFCSPELMGSSIVRCKRDGNSVKIKGPQRPHRISRGGYGWGSGTSIYVAAVAPCGLIAVPFAPYPVPRDRLGSFREPGNDYGLVSPPSPADWHYPNSLLN